MTDIIELATGKLNDPILMDWAISRYRQMENCPPKHREAMDQAWFDELTLRRWLDSDNKDVLTSLFVHLPAERFVNLGQAIGERWSGWSGNLAYHSAPILARYQPDIAWKCFAEPQGGRHQDVESILGVIRALPLLSHDDGLQLLKAITQQIVNSTKDEFARELMLSELISVSLDLDRAVAREIIKAHLEEITGERRLNMLLDQVARSLFGHSVYRQFAFHIRRGHTQQSFQQLGAFFREDAPLGQLDELSREKADLDNLTELANKFLDEKDRDVVRLIAETMRSNRFSEHRDGLADFLIGMVAATCENQELDTAKLSLQDSVDFLASDLSDPRHYEVMLARLGAFDRKDVTAVLVATLEKERNTFGGVWVAQAMGQLGWGSFVSPLKDAMCEDCSDFLCEAANTALIRIGEPARDYLIEHWDTLDSTQQIYGLSVIEVLGGEPAASFAVDRYEELLHEDPENWCQLVLSSPEQRLLDLLEQQLPRQQRLFDETFYLLAHLLDVTHPELNSVAERVKKAKTEHRERRAAFQRGEWFDQTLTLELKCPECGDTNEYKVKQIVVDSDRKVSDLLLADEFPCASCKRWVDFEFTAGAHTAITAELLKMASDSDEAPTDRSKALIMVEAPYHDRQLSVVEVISRCKESVVNDPGSIADWLRLGLCYQQVLSRPRYGLGYAERALELEPNAVEAVFQRANAKVAQGDSEEAFQLLDQALESKEHWRFFLTDVVSPAQFTAHFARLYNELLGRLGKSDRPRLHASFLGTSKKVGRNDPCPCGSGRKYKKCCLAKH